MKKFIKMLSIVKKEGIFLPFALTFAEHYTKKKKNDVI